MNGRGLKITAMFLGGLGILVLLVGGINAAYGAIDEEANQNQDEPEQARSNNNEIRLIGGIASGIAAFFLMVFGAVFFSMATHQETIGLLRNNPDYVPSEPSPRWALIAVLGFIVLALAILIIWSILSIHFGLGGPFG